MANTKKQIKNREEALKLISDPATSWLVIVREEAKGVKTIVNMDDSNPTTYAGMLIDFLSVQLHLSQLALNDIRLCLGGEPSEQITKEQYETGKNN